VKISNKKFSFFSSRNQYFPHIPYVASKKVTRNSLGLMVDFTVENGQEIRLYLNSHSIVEKVD
jgi:hypothetical protein